MFDLIMKEMEGRQSFIGYTSYTNRRITTTNFGIWLGYDSGELFLQMRYKHHIPKSRFGKAEWTNIKSVIALFDGVKANMKPNPLIFLPSARAVGFIERNTWKNLNIGIGQGIADKHKFIQYVDIFSPEFKYYDPYKPPFSILQELMWRESDLVTHNIANKNFYNYSEWLTE